jgi:hypothetical protein
MHAQMARGPTTMMRSSLAIAKLTANPSIGDDTERQVAR